MLEKVAKNALVRQMENRSVNMGFSGDAGAGNGARAAAGVSANRGSMSQAMSAQRANANRISSSHMARTFGDTSVDPLSTPLHQRLSEFKSKNGISSSANPAQKIDNANKMRQAGSSTFAGTGGAKGNQAAASMNKAMVDAKAGFKSHLNVGKTGVNMSTTNVHAANPGLLERAKGLLGKVKGKHLAMGAGALGAGVLASHLMHKKSQPDEYIAYR